MKIEEIIEKLKAGEKKAEIEAALSGTSVFALDMLEKLEAMTGKPWKIVRYASKSGMREGVDELPPFSDNYCEPSGGIIFASCDSELYGQGFIMLADSEPALSKRENIALKCGTYHIRYGSDSTKDRDIKNTIISDTSTVDLLRRRNSVIGAYTCREKTNEIDLYKGFIDPRITACVESILKEKLKGVDINVDGEDPVDNGAPRRKR